MAHNLIVSASPTTSAHPSYVDEQAAMCGLLSGKIIAVVGLSSCPTRSSYNVTRHLQQTGYRIVPVNPLHTDGDVLGEPYYIMLTGAAATLAVAGQRIDLVDISRRSEQVPPVVQEAMVLGMGGI